MAKNAIALLCAALAAGAIAQPAPPSIFGMTVGAEVDVPYCAGDTVSRQICVSKRVKDAKGLPYSGPAAIHLRCKELAWGSCAFAVEVVSGKLERVSMHTQGLRDQAAAMADLRRKFGDPTSMQVQLVTDSRGRSGQSVEAQWATQHVLVMFKGLVAGADNGYLLIETSVGREAFELRAMRERAAEAASKRRSGERTF